MVPSCGTSRYSISFSDNSPRPSFATRSTSGNPRCGRQASRRSISSRVGSTAAAISPPKKYLIAIGWTTTSPGGEAAAALLSGVSSDEGGPFHQGVEALVGSRNHALGKDHQRPAGFGKDIDGGGNRLLIDALTINAEDARPAQQPRLHCALREQVRAGHDVGDNPGLPGYFQDDERIGRAAVIRRQQHAVPRRAARL